MSKQQARTFSIFNLHNIIFKNKKIFFMVLAILSMVGAGKAYFIEPVYGFEQDLMVAHYIDGYKQQPLESTDLVMTKIEKIYLPDILRKYNLSHPSHPIPTGDIKVSIIPGTQVIQLHASAVDAQGPALKKFFGLLLTRILNSQKELLIQHLDTLKTKIEFNRRTIDSMNDVNGVIKAVLYKRNDNDKSNQQTLSDFLKKYNFSNGLEKSESSSSQHKSKQAVLTNNINEPLFVQLLQQSILGGEYNKYLNVIRQWESSKQRVLNISRDTLLLENQYKSYQKAQFITDFSRTTIPLNISKEQFLLLYIALVLMIAFIATLLVEYVNQHKSNLNCEN